MDVFEEVADTFSGASGCSITDLFSSRLGSLNLSFTSNSFDPAFTFSSSRSSSLHHCESTSRTSAAIAAASAAASGAAAPAASASAASGAAADTPSREASPPPLLLLPPVISGGPPRRHVHVLRRNSLPCGVATSTADPHADAATGDGAFNRLSTSGGGSSVSSSWSGLPSPLMGPAPPSIAARAAGAAGSSRGTAAGLRSGPAATSTSTAEAATPPLPPLPGASAQHSGAAGGAGLKRRSCPEPGMLSAILEPLRQQSPYCSAGQVPSPCTGGSRGCSAGGAPADSAIGGGGLCATPSSEPVSPSSSFASFAAALAARYYVDFGSNPDVPTHLEEVRQRDTKRSRVTTGGGGGVCDMQTAVQPQH
ncbi:hypothetical protein CHLRE_03g176000v5 [Chlamydomonas reinhardtii]|uniref:Uncharacterized protein n=1 Tax=Chlamydomonas reinhardtii TaxID=3055 RepID=A8IDZ4_CHLRE|nr:uncharacterized protein CHLRE_03g176000v5 [Chlamydomonas reinhardtii]PNW85202.1 hypothetical protein CHLRE_03g176000v5 [Chlamydomonas reinhardtii]|eukprot:XP_001703443.1 hypothetical protein CHLREDRAFT_205518 [Chlamydomonas reinhardtii]